MLREQAEEMAKAYLKDIFGPKDAREEAKTEQLIALFLSVAPQPPAKKKAAKKKSRR